MQLMINEILKFLVVIMFFLYLIKMAFNVFSGEHTSPLRAFFIARPEVDNSYVIWWLVYGIGFFIYLGLFVVMLCLFF